MAINVKLTFSLLLVTNYCIALVLSEGLRLPDQQPSPQSGQQNVQPIFHSQQQQPQQSQIPIHQGQNTATLGEERGRSSILSIFGLGQDSDPYLARTNGNCLGGDLSECFKTQALNTFDEIFYRDIYRLSDLARIVRLPETQQRSLLQEPFEYSEEPRQEDDDWNQLLKYGLRRAERFIKSTALEVEVPEDLTEAGRYEARFIGNDIDSELDVIEDKHAPIFKRKKLKKLIIPLILVLKIFKLKLLLFLPFILGIVGLKKILGLAAIILPGLFAYFKLCRPAGPSYGPSGGIFSGLFGSKNTVPEYSPQGVGSATYYHHHEHLNGNNGPFYRQEPTFSKPYAPDYYNKNYQTTANAVSFGGEPQEAAYSGYYGRSSTKDIQSTDKS